MNPVIAIAFYEKDPACTNMLPTKRKLMDAVYKAADFATFIS